MKDDGGPVFPHYTWNVEEGGVVLGGEGMSLRDYACIKLCIPETGKEWLDDLIRKAQRDQFAGKALTDIPNIGEKA